MAKRKVKTTEGAEVEIEEPIENSDIIGIRSDIAELKEGVKWSRDQITDQKQTAADLKATMTAGFSQVGLSIQKLREPETKPSLSGTNPDNPPINPADNPPKPKEDVADPQAAKTETPPADQPKKRVRRFL